MDDFSRTKKVLQSWGSWVVRQASETDIPDTTSGFRAYTRDAALRVNVVSRFTYTLETIIQAGKSDLAVTHVPVRTNPRTRESRLFRSTSQYVKRSVGTILRIYLMYEPLPVFLWPAALLGALGVALFGRFFYYYFTTSDGGAHSVAHRRGRTARLRNPAPSARRHQRSLAREPRHLGAHAPAGAQDGARPRGRGRQPLELRGDVGRA